MYSDFDATSSRKRAFETTLCDFTRKALLKRIEERRVANPRSNKLPEQFVAQETGE